MKRLINMFVLPMSDLIKDCYHFIAGLFMTTVGYFIPVKNIVHFLLFLFFLDVIVGVWHSKKIKKEPFHPKWIWEKTIPRLFITLIIIICLFIWDDVFSQEVIATYNLVGWFVSGMLIWSILDNGYRITKWYPFRATELMIGKRVKDETGYDLNEQENETKSNKNNC